MKRILTVLLSAAVFAPALHAIAFVQDPAADAVAEKYLAAMGGRDAIGKLTSRRVTGTVVFSTQGTDLTGPYEVATKAPNKVRVLIKLDLTPAGLAEMMTIEQKFDGASGVTTNSMQPSVTISGSQLEHMKNNAFPSPLLNYKAAGMKLELLPKEPLGGRDATVMVATPKTGPSMKLYFDPETGLLLRSVVRLNTPDQGDIEQVSEPSDYRVVDGVKVPFKIVNTSPNQTITIKIEKVEHNIPLDDSIFVAKGL